MVKNEDGCAPVGEDALSLSLLSSFQVWRRGELVNGRLGGKARQLLKILAANYRRSLPKDALIELLWPDADPSTGAISLKVAAHKLRSTLDPERLNGQGYNWLIAENGTYRLNPDARIWIDVEEFRWHHERGRELEAQGQVSAARHELHLAESLYKGDYLEDDVYEDWTILRREELRDLYLDTLQRLAHLSIREGAHADVIRYCHKIVLADPCREDAYRMLMASHAAMNQIARAGAWYAVCRTTLLREIGSPPSPETTETFEKLFTA